MGQSALVRSSLLLALAALVASVPTAVADDGASPYAPLRHDEPLALQRSGTAGPLAPDTLLPPPTHPHVTPEDLETASFEPTTDWVAPLVLGATLATMGVLGVQRTLSRRNEEPAAPAEAADEHDPEPLPAGLPGILHLGQDAVDRGAYDEALGWFDCAVRLDPDANQVHLCRGLCLVELERPDEALAAYTTAVSLDPTDGLARFHLAKAHGSLGHERDAIEALAPLVKAMPELADAAFKDPSFAALRDHPSFLGLVGRL